MEHVCEMFHEFLILSIEWIEGYEFGVLTSGIKTQPCLCGKWWSFRMQLCFVDLFLEERARDHLFSSLKGLHRVSRKETDPVILLRRDWAEVQTSQSMAIWDWLQRRPITQSYQDKFLAWSCGRGGLSIQIRQGGVIKDIEQVDPLSSGYIEEGWEVIFGIIYPALGLLFSESYSSVMIHTHIGSLQAFLSCTTQLLWLQLIRTEMNNWLKLSSMNVELERIPLLRWLLE